MNPCIDGSWNFLEKVSDEIAKMHANFMGIHNHFHIGYEKYTSFGSELLKFSLLTEIRILTENKSFDRNDAFRPKFRFLTNSSAYNFVFCPKNNFIKKSKTNNIICLVVTKRIWNNLV